jgi:hypothetical protein
MNSNITNIKMRIKNLRTRYEDNIKDIKSDMWLF